MSEFAVDIELSGGHNLLWNMMNGAQCRLGGAQTGKN